MQQKRVKLYNDFKEDAESNGLLDAFRQKYRDFTSWESLNFKDEQSVKSIYGKALNDIINPCSLNDFYKVFCCGDLEWAKQSQYCPKPMTDKERFSASDTPITTNGGVSKSYINPEDL